jgi:hypothetical protein
MKLAGVLDRRPVEVHRDGKQCPEGRRERGAGKTIAIVFAGLSILSEPAPKVFEVPRRNKYR